MGVGVIVGVGVGTGVGVNVGVDVGLGLVVGVGVGVTVGVTVGVGVIVGVGVGEGVGISGGDVVVTTVPPTGMSLEYDVTLSEGSEAYTPEVPTNGATIVSTAIDASNIIQRYFIVNLSFG